MIKTSVAAVAPNAMLPGDLAVWDGHVAMVVGDRMMIEAGVDRGGERGRCQCALH